VWLSLRNGVKATREGKKIRFIRLNVSRFGQTGSIHHFITHFYPSNLRFATILYHQIGTVFGIMKIAQGSNAFLPGFSEGPQQFFIGKEWLRCLKNNILYAT